MERKIGVIASDLELKNSITELFKEDVDKGEIIIDILSSNNMEEQGKILENKGAQAIVARSGGYIYNVGKVNVPVVHLKITPIDILRAVKDASKYNKEIVLFISVYEYFDYDELKDIITTNITIERFRIKEEIEERVYKYISKKEEIVIIGGGIPCTYAQKLGIDNVNIGASKESIYEAITDAKELVDNLYKQKYKNEVLQTVLDGVHDAVIAVDNESKIILYNERAEKLLKKSRNDVIDKKLLDVYPELGFMLDVLESKISQYNQIKKLKRIIVTSNISVLEVDGHINGVLCSFQDITKLQSLEKKIRYEINKKGLVAKYNFYDFIAYDPVTKDTVAKAIKIGLTDSTVMIYGESGTGKEMMAQSIHNISSRKEDPFVAVNCAAISENLLESELFGYEEGAFTGARKGGKPGLFELAHGGTIFLDEINSMSLNLQAKLLRVLEEKEVMRIGSDYVIPLDVRVIAAANEELKEKVKEGNFRSDLFYRLNILKLSIPPLRQRKEDIVPLFKHYIKELSQENHNIELSDVTKNKIINHIWTGNVRELKNVAQRYVLFNEIDLDEDENKDKFEDKAIKSENILDINDDISLKDFYESLEEKVIDILSSKGVSNTEIAKHLGISRTALWKKKKIGD
jgi:transcriptional regulator, propionate catabolism operon regulatory protein